jgi:hypothetical protein
MRTRLKTQFLRHRENKTASRITTTNKHSLFIAQATQKHIKHCVGKMQFTILRARSTSVLQDADKKEPFNATEKL